ncbi:glycoside hydrolase family 18 protein [bacterium]|nr:glycoside hydrolase family 18 protein [bacterium]
MILLIFLLFFIANAQFNVSSWWVGDIHNPTFPISKLNWKMYTHLHYSGPMYNTTTGEVYCNKTDHDFHHFVHLAHTHNVRVMWGAGETPMTNLIWEMNDLKINFFKTIGKAMRDCNVDGIEIDYEYSIIAKKQLGIVSFNQSNHYSHFLAELKTAVGKDKLVAADISIEGIGKANWILGFLPWINTTMLNRGDFDYVNTMSYHWSRFGSLWAWKKDMFFIDLWGIDRKRVNIGIPYYSDCPWTHKGGLWKTLSKICPKIDISENVCDSTVFVGKQMNYEIGQLIRENGFRGAFPWAANYDSVHFNNSLIKWLHKGLMND